MQSLVLLNTLQGANFLCLLSSVASNNYLRPEQSSIGHSVWLIILIPSVSCFECTVDLMVVTPREGWLSHTCKSQHERIDFGFIWKKKKRKKILCYRLIHRPWDQKDAHICPWDQCIPDLSGHRYFDTRRRSISPFFCSILQAPTVRPC